MAALFARLAASAVPWRLIGILGIVAGVLFGLWTINDRAYDRAKADDKPTIDALNRDLAVSESSTQELIDAAGMTHAAIVAWRARRDADVQSAHDALAATAQRASSTSALIARLGQPTRSAASCPARIPTPEEDKAWSVLSR